MRYITIRHKQTGEEVVIDRYMARYNAIAKGFLNSNHIKPRFIKHITLTQVVENYKPNILNAFFVFMRRYYGDIMYVWTCEQQERGVLHWHILVGFEWGIKFGREDILRIQRYWKYGNVDIKPVTNISISYIMKYLGKALTEDFIGNIKLRRIGSSRIAGWLKQSMKYVVLVLSFFASIPVSPDHFYWYRGSAYTYYENSRDKLWIYRKPPSGWCLVDRADFST